MAVKEPEAETASTRPGNPCELCGRGDGDLILCRLAVLDARDIRKRQISRNTSSVIHDEPGVAFASFFVWRWQIRVVRCLDIVPIAAIEDQDERHKRCRMQLFFKKQ